MRTTQKFLMTSSAALLGLLVSGLAHATLIHFSIEGTIMNAPAGYSLLPVGSKITATGTFDDNNAPLNGNILFNQDSGNALYIDLSTLGHLAEDNDSRFDSTHGGFLTFSAGSITGLDYRSYYYLGDNPYGIKFTSSDLYFDNGGPTTLYGMWDSASIVLAPVPVPAAVWLFGSGLVGLAGIARRKRSA